MSHPQSPPDPKRWIALVLLCAAQFMVVLDASIVNVALPSIQTDLGLLAGEPAVGRQRLHARVRRLPAARRAHGRPARAGGACSSSAWACSRSPRCSAASRPNEGQLIAARALQGLGAAIISPAALSIVTTTFAEGSERNKALGIWGAIAGLGGAVGVLLGGMLTEWAGWEWVLFVNVPIGIAAAVLTPRFVRESRAEQPAARHFDALGAVTITAGLVLLVYTLVKAEDYGWGAGRTIGVLAGSVALIGAVRRSSSRARGRRSRRSRSSASARRPAPTSCRC